MTEGRTGTALLTPRAASVVDAASGPADVLRRLIDSGHVAEPLRAIGVDPASLSETLHPDFDSVSGSGRVLEHAEREAQALGHDQVDAIHLLMGLLYNDLPGAARRGAAARPRGVNLYDLRTYALRAKQAAPSAAPARVEGPRLGQALHPSPAFLVPAAAFAAGGVALYGGPPGWAVTPLPDRS